MAHGMGCLPLYREGYARGNDLLEFPPGKIKKAGSILTGPAFFLLMAPHVFATGLFPLNQSLPMIP